MAKKELANTDYEPRRRKEELAFLVVKFLKAYASFQEIRAGFHDAARRECLESCGLFEKVRLLEESLAFDLKEKAHYLFRSATAPHGSSRAATKDTRRLLAELKISIETKTVDAYIGTGFHLLLMLRESLYQIQRYAPEFELERQEIARIEELTREVNPGAEAQRDLEHLRALSEISVKLAADSVDTAHRIMARCDALFKRTAEVIRHLMMSARDNEILLQNLLQNVELLEVAYGEGSAELIFSDLLKSRRVEGKTGHEKALAYAKARCGNITRLSAKPVPSV